MPEPRYHQVGLESEDDGHVSEKALQPQASSSVVRYILVAIAGGIVGAACIVLIQYGLFHPKIDLDSECSKYVSAYSEHLQNDQDVFSY